MADIDVRCKECDSLLDAEFIRFGRQGVVLAVEICERCKDNARAEGYDHGKEEANGA